MEQTSETRELSAFEGRLCFTAEMISLRIL
jgi:hypothetical protein